jgi:hypothetical protein
VNLEENSMAAEINNLKLMMEPIKQLLEEKQSKESSTGNKNTILSDDP